MAGEISSEYVRFSEEDLDRIDQGVNYMAPVLESLTKAYAFKDVLDIGCGSGFFSSYLKRQGTCRLVGVDGSEYALKKAAERKFDATQLIGDLSSERINLADASFDLLICKDVLEHLVNPLFVVSEAVRLLRPGGLFLAMVPNHFPLFYRFKFLFDADLDTQKYFPDAQQWDFPHLRFFTYEGFIEMFKSHGFSVERNYAADFPCVPFVRRLPGGKALVRSLATAHPTQFAAAFPVLFKKK